eukprot:scaffold122020_cov18-Tisochrysis_lutea.AAC.2
MSSKGELTAHPQTGAGSSTQSDSEWYPFNELRWTGWPNVEVLWDQPVNHEVEGIKHEAEGINNLGHRAQKHSMGDAPGAAQAYAKSGGKVPLCACVGEGKREHCMLRCGKGSSCPSGTSQFLVCGIFNNWTYLSNLTYSVCAGGARVWGQKAGKSLPKWGPQEGAFWLA